MDWSWEPGGDGPLNMGRDLEMLALAEAGRPAGRLYDWSAPWVTLGRFQHPQRALLPAAPTPWIMRTTGGKAVLHGHDLTLGFALPLAPLGLQERRLTAVYRAVIGPLIEALVASGRPAALGETTPFVRSGGHTADCFAHVAPNDVVDPATGAKVCGVALRVTSEAVLVQASLPVRAPAVDPAEVFASPWVPGSLVEVDPERLRAELERAFARLVR